MKLLGPCFLAALFFLSACASFPEAPARTTEPRLEADVIVSVDGARLGLTRWPAADPAAIIIAVHGMNDYAGAFRLAGPYWAERGIATYAFDQRGFGRSAPQGRWPGADALRTDLSAVIAAVRKSSPTTPVYLLGHSMGAAVVMSANGEVADAVDGTILAAPGVWGADRMPLFYRLALNVAAAIAPGKTLTGESAGRQASDNIDFLRAMYHDPHVIKDTRLNSVLGVVRLMGEGWKASDRMAGPTLFLYGEKDEIIPVDVQRKAAAKFPNDPTIIAYEDGWHLLFADTARERVLSDVADWVLEQNRRRKPPASPGE